MARMHELIANDVPKVARGQVWCKRCGRTQKVNGATCLQYGWPECCDETMTIDSPEEQRPPASSGVPGEIDGHVKIRLIHDGNDAAIKDRR